MIVDTIKQLADFLMTLANPSGYLGKNYKQLPLPVAIIICIAGLAMVSLLFIAGVSFLFGCLK